MRIYLCKKRNKKIKTSGWMNGRFFKVLKGPMKPDYFVALLFGCSLLTWPFVKLALKDLCSPDGGLKMIVKDLLTLLFPFSVKRVKMATLNEVWYPSPWCIQGIFFVLFCLFCLIFHQSRLPTLNLLFIVNSMNVQYDAILAKIICGVIVLMFPCVLINRLSQ